MRREGRDKGTHICDIIGALARLVLLEQLLGRRAADETKGRPEHTAQHAAREKRRASHAPRVVELLEPVREDLLLLVLLHERVPPAQAVELVDHPLEELRSRGAPSAARSRTDEKSSGRWGGGGAYRRDARVVGEHEPAHTVVGLHVRRAAGERDLDRGRAPGDEVGELALANAEERLVDLGGYVSWWDKGEGREQNHTSVGSTSPWIMFKIEM